MQSTARYIVGIDEVGRGPVAGPVAVCAVRVARDTGVELLFPGVRDSKTLSPKKRERIFDEAQRAVAAGAISFFVSYSAASAVDAWGIEEATKRALFDALERVAPNPHEVFVCLDGRLKAPRAYAQETLVGGDARVPAISLASVIAKVSRDRHMETIAEQNPGYGFERHKGYGTREHLACIRTLGMCPEHRRSFLSKIRASIAV